mmetsp:Transcript_15564/g.41774  ORF Transcript_15564/g.41774 Transcript_15564/m.41774 type:complete len:540 (+) Transcript_15564:60-1679(+)
MAPTHRTAGGRLVDEAMDLKTLLNRAKTERMRTVINLELQAVVQELEGREADVGELRALLLKARRQTVRALLEREISSREAELVGAQEVLSECGVTPAGHAATPLPAFCWRSRSHAEVALPRFGPGSDTTLEQKMARAEPFVLTGSRLCGPSVRRWTPEYLAQAYGEDVECTVFEAPAGVFRYWNEANNSGGYPFPEDAHSRKLSMTMKKFVECAFGPGRKAPPLGMDDARVGQDREHLYLQSALVQGVGETLVGDFLQFDWGWATDVASRVGWDELTSNLLLVGQRGNVTPPHFDEQENLLAQLAGRKRVLLWAPKDWNKLYPFPLHHPNDRQSQVDMRAPDLERFPRFAEAQAFEAVLEPGDVLFIPQYWWHHVENLDDGCVSVNFWFKHSESEVKVGARCAPRRSCWESPPACVCAPLLTLLLHHQAGAPAFLRCRRAAPHHRPGQRGAAQKRGAHHCRDSRREERACFAQRCEPRSERWQRRVGKGGGHHARSAAACVQRDGGDQRLAAGAHRWTLLVTGAAGFRTSVTLSLVRC